MTEKPASKLYETCRYDGKPYPCPVHVGCYAAGFDRCQDVRTTVTEDERVRWTETRCHTCGSFYGAMCEPSEFYVCTGDDACEVPSHWPDRRYSGPHRGKVADLIGVNA